MQKSPIEWTNFTANPIRARHKRTGKVGWHCEKISAGCANCYSEVIDQRFGTQTPFTSHGTRDIELFLDTKEIETLATTNRKGRVFLCDMTDLFMKGVPFQWVDQIMATIAVQSKLTFQILTKWPERMERYFASRALGEVYTNVLASMADERAFTKSHLDHVRGTLRLTDSWEIRDGYTKFSPPKEWPLPNLWLGVSAENQEWADKRIPYLQQTPAAVRFVSFEPLIGEIDAHEVGAFGVGAETCNRGWDHEHGKCDCLPSIDWAIVGSESGNSNDVRPCEVDWIRAIVRQCKTHGVPAFVKQLGRFPVIERTVFDPPKEARNGVITQEIKCLSLRHAKGGDPAEWPEDLRVREFPQPRAEATR